MQESSVRDLIAVVSGHKIKLPDGNGGFYRAIADLETRMDAAERLLTRSMPTLQAQALMAQIDAVDSETSSRNDAAETAAS